MEEVPKVSHLARLRMYPRELGDTMERRNFFVIETLLFCAIISAAGLNILVAIYRDKLMRLAGGSVDRALTLVMIDFVVSTAVLFGITVLIAG